MRLVLSKDFNFGTKNVMLGYLRHITRIKFTKKIVIFQINTLKIQNLMQKEKSFGTKNILFVYF